MNVSIFGIGNFGFALLKYLDHVSAAKSYKLHAFDRNGEVRNRLITHHTHPIHHKGIKISNRVVVEDSIENLIIDCDILILATTSNSIKEVVDRVKPYIKSDIIVVNTAKALGAETGTRLSIIIENSLKSIKHKYSIACLSGGMIASDIVKGDPLGADLASKDRRALGILKGLFQSRSLKIYTTKDLAGVEYAGAFKNVISILAGIMKGLGFTYGSETYIIARAANEAMTLAVNLGAKEKTFSSTSQSWGNDMVMSTTGNTRNREFGILLGEGYNVEDALTKMRKENKTVEGIHTVKILRKLIGKNKDKFTLLYNLGSIIFDHKGNHTKRLILDIVHSNRI